MVVHTYLPDGLLGNLVVVGMYTEAEEPAGCTLLEVDNSSQQLALEQLGTVPNTIKTTPQYNNIIVALL